MRKYLTCLLVVPLIVFLSLGNAFGAADPLASAKTQALLQYFIGLPNGTTNRILSGQYNQADDSYAANHDAYTAIYTKTTKYPAVLGWDPHLSPGGNRTTQVNLLITHGNAGGIVQVSGIFKNPVSGGDAYDVTAVDFVQLITNGTTTNTNFKAYLDEYAGIFQQLSNANIPVIFRPFGEMNSPAANFWYAYKTPTQFTNAWIYVFNYLTQTKGLHNILFDYHTTYWNDPGHNYTAYYPGSAYVDIVGFSLYEDSLTAPCLSQYTTPYNALVAYGKPFAIGEWGPCSGSTPCAAKNIASFLTSVKNCMSSAIYFMNWSFWWAEAYHNDTAALLNDAWVVTRDELPSFGTDTTLPVVTAFVIPATSASLIVAITTFTATDNVAVAQYCVSETNSGASCTPWSATKQTSFTFLSAGTKTLYAFAKDAAGNISASLNDSVVITLPGDTTAPTVTAFVIPSTVTSLTVPITTFTATDNVAVTSYCVSETNVGSTCSPWAATPQASFTFPSQGTRTLYAFAKDAAGNISASLNDSVVIALPAGNLHWVSTCTSGCAAWLSCTGASQLTGTSACSLATANASAVAGDLIMLNDGVYATDIAPANSGNCNPPSVPIADSCKIRYQAINPLMAIVTRPVVNSYGITLDGKNWIKVDGIKVWNTNGYPIYIRNYAHHNEITNCETGYDDTVSDKWISYIGGNCYSSTYGCPVSHLWIHSNTFHDVKNNDGTCLEGSNVIELGSASSGDSDNHHITFEDNLLYHGSHGTMETFGKQYVVRNNVAHNEGFKTYAVGCTMDADSVGHYPGNHKYSHRNWGIDSIPRDGTTFSWILLEGNRLGYAGANGTNNGAENINLSTVGVLMRYNAIYGADGNGVYFKNSIANYNKLYNNTFFGNGQWNGAYGSIDITTVSITLGCHDNAFKNNIIYGNGGNDFNCHGTGCNPYTQMDINTNWCSAVSTPYCTKSGNPLFVSTPTVDDSVMASLTLPDLNLQLGSPARNVGTHLTTTTNSGVNQLQLAVADSLYFQDGTWGSDLTRDAGTLHADWIAIGSVGNTVQISSINYTTHTITLASAKSWSVGAPVWLYKKSDGAQVLYGTAPDLGAYPYQVAGTEGDMIAPVITAFVIPATSTSLNVPITIFTATDNIGVTGYCLVETSNSATCTWEGTAPTSYPFASAGLKILYAFAKDVAGNISASASQSVTITLSIGGKHYLDEGGNHSLGTEAVPVGSKHTLY